MVSATQPGHLGTGLWDWGMGGHHQAKANGIAIHNGDMSWTKALWNGFTLPLSPSQDHHTVGLCRGPLATLAKGVYNDIKNGDDESLGRDSTLLAVTVPERLRRRSGGSRQPTGAEVAGA